MLVSFIIPAYNATDTIVRCLDSIYALPLKHDEFEVIVIDDYSSDGTVQIIEDWRLKIENLTLLCQPENHRQGAARNRGVKIAKGEYICFVDSDDAVTEGIIDAIRRAKAKNADMVAFHYGNANEQGEMTAEAERLSFEVGQIFTGIEMQNKHPYWCSAPWGYIYHKEFLDEVNYPFVEDVLFEDSDFVVVHLYYAKRMVYSMEMGYMVCQTEKSSTRGLNYKNVADYLLLGVRMMAFYERIMSDVLCVASDVLKGEVENFAEGILEGACFNVAKSCKRIIKLPNVKEVNAYYNRIDDNVDRAAICNDKGYRRYYWNLWTGFCMRSRNIVIVSLALCIPIYRLFKH